MMKVYSIDPNTNKYFLDLSYDSKLGNKLYQGKYNYTPIYPLYTFNTNGRFNYNITHPEIEFYTMIPVKDSLVEVRVKFNINNMEENSLNVAIDEFNKFCNTTKKYINVDKLIHD